MADEITREDWANLTGEIKIVQTKQDTALGAIDRLATTVGTHDAAIHRIELNCEKHDGRITRCENGVAEVKEVTSHSFKRLVGVVGLVIALLTLLNLLRPYLVGTAGTGG